MKFSVKFLENECFWGGPIEKANEMPINVHSDYSRDFTRYAGSEMMPLFISNMGRYVWSENSFKVWIQDGELCFEGTDFELYENGKNLRDAYLVAMEKHFPFDETRKDKKKLPREFFKTAQYNTWMEFTYNPTQKGVLQYAHAILDNGFDPGILIIDEGWHTRYGIWEFDFYKFPDPKAMIDELHSLGFKVMLWVTPLVTPDGQAFIETYLPTFNTTDDKLFLRNKNGDIALVSWWNGFSAILDMRKECDRNYLDSKLKYLMDTYGVDGFKFDGGNYSMYHPLNVINGEPADDMDPIELNIAWNVFGTKYKFHEYKDSFKAGGKATIERLCDRNHDWNNGGINTLLPCALMQGLMGYPFICPDMIGGGEWTYNFLPGFNVDEELFVRMAEASALFPMMQFSWAPWRALSKDNFGIVLKTAKLHNDMADTIVDLVSKCEETGEPILRALEYNDPHKGYENIVDEFMLGEDILVCPIVTKGTFKKEIVFPTGVWQDEFGNEFPGNTIKTVDTPIDRLPWFKRIK